MDTLHISSSRKTSVLFRVHLALCTYVYAHEADDIRMPQVFYRRIVADDVGYCDLLSQLSGPNISLCSCSDNGKSISDVVGPLVQIQRLFSKMADNFRDKYTILILLIKVKTNIKMMIAQSNNICQN